MTELNNHRFEIHITGASRMLSSTFRKLTGVGLLAFSTTLGYGVAQAFYYWPILQYKISALSG